MCWKDIVIVVRMKASEKMLRIGDKITIRSSKNLMRNGLSNLVNKTGVITRILNSQGKLLGVYADVKVMRRMRNYYIPVESIEGPDSINRVRTLSILKSTIL